MTTLYRGMDQATLDREYNARATVPDFPAELRRYQDRSAAARAALRHRPGLVYDPASANALDWFDGAPGGPVLLWIHGGYWRALSKDDNSCVAPGLVAAGAHVAVMDYSLAPAATLDTIAAQVRTAFDWVRAHATAHGADPERCFVGGSSAGGHLAALLACETDGVAGILALSGLFDLDPIPFTHINAWLSLDAAAARRLSPRHRIPNRPAAPLLAGYGADETSEFKRQTEDFAAAWAAAGHEATVLPQAGLHHFDIVLALGDTAHPLCRAAAAFMGEPGACPP